MDAGAAAATLPRAPESPRRYRRGMSAGTLTTSTAPTSADRLRQVGVTLAEVFCVVGTLVGVGVIGTRVEESSGGALAADATLVAPAGPAFSIWTPIYLGLLGYTVWQWLPQQAVEPRHRAIGWLVAVSMVLNAGWLLVTQQGWLWASVLVIVGLALTLGLLVRRLQEHPSYGHAETVLVDGTFGLYLGWVSVATVANITTTLIESGIDPGGIVAEVLAVLVLAVAAGLGVLFAVRLGGRWAVALAMAWGLGWIGFGRLADEPASVLVGLAALVAAAVVLWAPTRVRSRAAADTA